MCHRSGWLVAVLASFLAPLAAPAAGATPSRLLHSSDVVFMYDDPRQYAAYGCSVLGWAGPDRPEQVRAAHAAGVRVVSVSVGFRTEFARMIDFSPDFRDAVCRNFAGEPIAVPWLWDHHHKGEPAWWFCTNSPLYRRYLDGRLAEIARTDCDCLHIDDYTGTAGMVTWKAGCFCRHCLAGFRDYLRRNMAPEKLAALGVRDLDTFDYRQFLLDRGVRPEEYSRRRASLPLATEFLDFQVKAADAFVVAYHRRAEELCGRPLGLCVNSGLTDPASLVIAPHLTHFCCEVGHGAGRPAAPTHPIYVYKLADGLNRPVAATASGQDWAYVKAHRRPGLVRTWVALAYAFGHNFKVPHRQWCYTEQEGTSWYAGPPEEYAWLYQVVRENAGLLNGYEAVAPVAVVYDNTARRRGRGDIEPICAALAESNVPFTVVVAGDDWLDYRLEPSRLEQFRAVVVAGEPAVDAAQRELLERVRASGRLVTWPDRAALEKLVPSPVAVDGGKDVLAAVRARPGDSAAPVAVHLLNRRYDADTDATVVQQDLTVRLRRDLLGNRVFSRAVLHVPRAAPRELAVTADAEHVTVNVPALDLWGIVELR
jgi:hypothetical protein